MAAAANWIGSHTLTDTPSLPIREFLQISRLGSRRRSEGSFPHRPPLAFYRDTGTRRLSDSRALDSIESTGIRLWLDSPGERFDIGLGCQLASAGNLLVRLVAAGPAPRSVLASRCRASRAATILADGRDALARPRFGFLVHCPSRALAVPLRVGTPALPTKNGRSSRYLCYILRDSYNYKMYCNQ